MARNILLVSVMVTDVYSAHKPIFRRDAAKLVEWQYLDSSGRLDVTWQPEKMVKNGRNLDRNKLRIQIKASQDEDYVNVTTKPKRSHWKYQHTVSTVLCPSPVQIRFFVTNRYGTEHLDYTIPCKERDPMTSTSTPYIDTKTSAIPSYTKTTAPEDAITSSTEHSIINPSSSTGTPPGKPGLHASIWPIIPILVYLAIIFGVWQLLWILLLTNLKKT